MPQKKVIMVGMVVGSLIGGYIPVLFGAGSFSFTSLFASGAGAILGIWLVYRLTR
jgi:hypothetical protein